MFYKKYIEFINKFNYVGHLLLNYQLISILFVLVFTSHLNTLCSFENLDNQDNIENQNTSNLTKNEGLCLFIFMSVVYLAQIYFYLYNKNIDLSDQLSEISNIDFNLDIADSKLLDSNLNRLEDLPSSVNPILESQKIPSIETIYNQYYAEEK